MEAAGTSVCLVMKAVLLSAHWAGRSRRLALAQAAKAADDGVGAEADNVMLRDTIELLVEQLACAQRRLKAANIRMPYSPAERLHILWCVEYFGIPRRQIPKHFGVARSTVWRWLRRLQDGIGLCGRKCQGSVRRTSEELVQLVAEQIGCPPRARARSARARRAHTTGGHFAIVVPTSRSQAGEIQCHPQRCLLPGEKLTAASAPDNHHMWSPGLPAV